MLIASSNDAAESLRSVTDERLNEMGTTTTALELMNQIAKENGFNTLYFDSPSGLDATDGVASAYGSALDITLLMVKIMKDAPEIFEATREPVVMRGPIGGTLRDYKNTNISSNTLPGLLASKTGFTDAAGGNLVVMFDAGLGLPVVISILGSVDQDTRFDDMKELVSKSIRYLNGTYQ
jgi:D-alanyl-D-alanine carboxypeptidase